MKYLKGFNENVIAFNENAIAFNESVETFKEYLYGYYINKYKIDDFHFEESFYELTDDGLVDVSVRSDYYNNSIRYQVDVHIKTVEFSKLVEILSIVKDNISSMVGRVNIENSDIKISNVTFETYKNPKEYMGSVKIYMTQTIEKEDENDLHSRWIKENEEFAKLLTKLKKIIHDEEPDIEFDERIEIYELPDGLIDIGWWSPYEEIVIIAIFDMTDNSYKIYEEGLGTVIDDWINYRQDEFDVD